MQKSTPSTTLSAQLHLDLSSLELRTEARRLLSWERSRLGLRDLFQKAKLAMIYLTVWNTTPSSRDKCPIGFDTS